MAKYPRTTEDIVAEVRGEQDEKDKGEDGYNLSDAGNAELYAALYGDRVRYDHRRGFYFVWNGEAWAADCDGALTRLAVRAARRRGMAAFVRGE
jgi:hypothetical protein